jgi:hypothetical protein
MLNQSAKSRNHYITTTFGISGYFAVMRAEYEDEPGEWMEDNVTTGIGRYRTKERAIIEAKQWAKEEGIPYKA